MAVVNGEPGFTQLTKVNVKGRLFVGGNEISATGATVPIVGATQFQNLSVGKLIVDGEEITGSSPASVDNATYLDKLNVINELSIDGSLVQGNTIPGQTASATFDASGNLLSGDNVTSITKHATGDFEVFFTNAFPNTGYGEFYTFFGSSSTRGGTGAGIPFGLVPTYKTDSSIRFHTLLNSSSASSGVLFDFDEMSCFFLSTG